MWAKKKKGKSPGYYPCTRMDLKRAGWCMNNGIKIALCPSKRDHRCWQIELYINDKLTVDPVDYNKPKEAYEKLYEYYKYYYEKYNKEDMV